MKLNDYKDCFNLSFDQYIAKYNVSNNQVHEHLGYEKLTDVTRVDRSNCEWLFFKNGKLAVIYISNEALVEKIWKEIKDTIKVEAPEKKVRSRAGKTSNQLIFATQGITASVDKDEIHFIELYPPCSVDEYLNRIYDEVGPFVR